MDAQTALESSIISLRDEMKSAKRKKNKEQWLSLREQSIEKNKELIELLEFKLTNVENAEKNFKAVATVYKNLSSKEFYCGFAMMKLEQLQQHPILEKLD